MTDSPKHHFFNQILAKALGKSLKVLALNRKSGGCISHAAEIVTEEGAFFIKWGAASTTNTFATEQRDLDMLQGKSSLRVPAPLSWGEMEGQYFLLMEAIEVGSNTAAYWENIGNGIAELHQHTAKDHGLLYDNFIGRLVQKNTFTSSWHQFFIEQRLNVQLELALKNKLVDTAFARKYTSLYDKLPNIIPDLPPSLLHGDLWSGNILAAVGNHACVIDPAVYYGSREIEIAFTYLFGGFDPLFYKSYNNAFPLAKGFEERIPIYNLYPLMVHANMFGAAYLASVKSTINLFQ